MVYFLKIFLVRVAILALKIYFFFILAISFLLHILADYLF